MSAKYFYGKTIDGAYVPLKVDSMGRIITTGFSGYTQVNTYADLPDPTTVSGKIYIVLTSTGIPFINRKSAGAYRSNGSAWSYLGDVEPYFSDGVLTVYNASDTTKKVMFDASGISTSTTRTFAYPDKSGTFAMLSDVPATGDFLQKANNLSDVQNAATAASNIGLGTEDSPQFTGATVTGIANLNEIQLDTTPSLTAQNPGKMRWDDTNGTLAIELTAPGAGNDVTLQVGQESHIYAKNTSGVAITNGQVVKISGASGNRVAVGLAQADTLANAQAVAVATAEVADNGFGYFTTFGNVGSINTNSYNEGDTLYLSASSAGNFTATAPTGTNVVVKIATVTNKHVNQGSIHVNVSEAETAVTHTFEQSTTQAEQRTALGLTSNATSAVNAETVATVSKDPTGFTDPENITVSYDSATRKVTLTGTVAAYWRGVVVPALVSGWVSDAHDATNGNWFLYYNGSVFVWSTTPWTFDMLMIAAVRYQTAYKFGVRECHGLMPHTVHNELHNVIRTWRASGGALSGYTLSSTTAAERRPDVEATVVWDEDIKTTNAALSSKLYTQMHLAGAGATNTFVVDAADIVPLSTNQPYYNQLTGGAWQQTLLTANQYMAVWLIAVPVSSDATSQKFRYLWLQGQSASSTLATIQALTPANLSLGDFTSFSPEFVFVAKVILRYTAGNWVLTQVDVISQSSATSFTTTTGLTSVATDGTLSGIGTPASPLSVQHTFETISKNIQMYDASYTYNSGILSTVTYTLPGGSVVKTLNYTLGVLTSVVLSGAGLPSGLTKLTKTLSYTGSELTGISYS